MTDSGGKATFEDAVRILARRSHGRFELKGKLKRRGHDDAEIEAAFGRLDELGYLEPEDEVAIRYATELASKKGATPRFVAHKLAQRGFESGCAQVAVRQAFRGWDWRVAALETVEGVEDPDKAARRLTRRGFSSDAVSWVVSRLRRPGDPQ